VPETPHRRRPRYSGRNPRHFDEKYKELDPGRFPRASWRRSSRRKDPRRLAPPGPRRGDPEALRPELAVAVDATLGHGGHAAELLPRLLPGGRLLGLDTDPLEVPRTQSRLRGLGFGDDVLTVRRSSFAGLPKVLAELGLPAVDLVLADLGISSMQLDDPSRGFTFKADGPLDMRMNPSRGLSAADLLARIPPDRLAQLLKENSDEPYAEEIASGLVAARTRAPVTTTLGLAAIVREALAGLPARSREEAGDDPVRRTFQALRIEVNDELGALRAFRALPPACPGRRVAILASTPGRTGW
jgi:16S rRNA (cytosine1402-N4)-methyltransferase